MKIPKIFTVEGKEREIKKHAKKERKYDLEDFIDKEIIGYKNSSIYNIDITNQSFLPFRGIEPEIVEKAVFANYAENTIILIQYKTQEDLTKNLKQFFKKGIIFYENHSEIKFIEIFLFKNNIAVYLQGKDDFNKEAAEHYRKKGFKQLDYELKTV